MFKSLTKSINIMFLFDLLILTASTYFWTKIFGFTPKAILFLCVLIVIGGLIVLYMKGNYKIREFNITFKNTYLLFEGIVMAHILPMIYLIFCATTISAIKFLVFNILTTFVILRLYRAFFHLYLFHVKPVKNILILGTDERSKIIADEINFKKALRMKVVGFVQGNSSEDEIIPDNNLTVYKESENLGKIVKDNDIDIVVITKPTELIMTLPRDVEIYKMPDFYEIVTGKYYIDEKSMTELYINLCKNAL